MAAMREIDSGRGMAEVACMYQPRVESETASGQTTGEIKPTWADVKINRARLDRAALLGVLQDLYAAVQEDR